ncbi:MAG: hypothetical protein GY948_22000 [Alphaproteobacteria bacterium]|nr:hypothetical protein [Alphaproteobacteria bacterium]
MLDATGAERRKLVDEFLRLSEGSFLTVYQALNAAAKDNQGATGLNKDDVVRHISRLRGSNGAAATARQPRWR